MMNRTSKSTIGLNSRKTHPNNQWSYLYWKTTLNSKLSLVSTVNHFVNDSLITKILPFFLRRRSSLVVRVRLLNLSLKIATLEIALANISRDVVVLLDVADVHQCNKVDFPYLLFLCAFLQNLLSFLFHCPLSIWTQHCLKWNMFCLCFSVSWSMRLWEKLQNLQIHNVKKTQRRTLLRCFHRNEVVRKTVTNYRFPCVILLQYRNNWSSFLPQIFELSPMHLSSS